MMSPPATTSSANSDSAAPVEDSTAPVEPQHAAMATVQSQPRVPFSRANLIRAQAAAQVREPAPARTAFPRANRTRLQVAARDVATASQRPIFSRANLLRAQAPVAQSPDEIQQRLQQMLAETPEISQTSLPTPESEAPLPTTTPAPASQGFLGRILGGVTPDPTSVETTEPNETIPSPIEETNSKPEAVMASMASVASVVVQETRVQKMMRERMEAKRAARTPIARGPAPPPPTLITQKPEPPPPPSATSIPDEPTPTQPAPGALLSRFRTGSVASLSSPVDPSVADSTSHAEASPMPLVREPTQARNLTARVPAFAQVVQETRVQKMMRERMEARAAARTPIAASASVPTPSPIVNSDVQKPEPTQISMPIQTRTLPPAPPPIVTQGEGFFSRLVGGANASTPVDSPTSAQADSPLDIPTPKTMIETSPLSTTVSRSANISRSQATHAPPVETRAQKMMRERMAARSPIVSSPVSNALKQTDSLPVVAERLKSEIATADTSKLEPEAPQPNVTQDGGFFSRFVGGSTASTPYEVPTAAQIPEAITPIAVPVQAPVAPSSLVVAQKTNPESPKPEPAKPEGKGAEPKKPEPTRPELIESTPVSAVASQGGFFSRFIGRTTTASEFSKPPETSEISKPEPVAKLTLIETNPVPVLVSVDVKPVETIPVAPTPVAAPQGGGFFSRFIGGATSTPHTVTEPVDEYTVLKDTSSSANATVNISTNETPMQQRTHEKMAAGEPMTPSRTLQIPKQPTIQPPTPIETPRTNSAPSNGPAGFFDFSNIMVATASEESRIPLPADLFSSATLVIPTVEVSMSEDTAPLSAAPDSRFLVPPMEKQGEPDISSGSEPDPKPDPVEEKKVTVAAPAKKSAAEADAAAQAEIAAILAEMQAAEEEAARAMASKAKSKPDPDEIARAEIAAILAEAEAAQRAEEDAAQREAARVLAQEKAAYQRAQEEAAKIGAARVLAEAEAAKKAKEDAAQREAARVLAQEKAAYQRAQEEAAKIEAARVLAEAEAARRAEEEAAKKEAMRVLAEAEAAKKAKEDAAQREAARVLAQEKAAYQRAQEEAAKIEAARVLAEAKAARRVEEEDAKKEVARVFAQAQAAHQRAQEEAARVLAQAEAAQKAEEEAAKADAARVLAELAAELDMEDEVEDFPPPVPEKDQRDEKAEAAAILAQLAAELDEEEEDDYANERIDDDDDDDEIDKLFAKHGLDNENDSDITTLPPQQHRQLSNHASSVNVLGDDTPPPPPPKDKVFVDTNITPQTLQRIIAEPVTPSGIPTSEEEIYSRISSLVIWRSISSGSRNSMRARAETGSSITTTTTNRTADRRTTISSLGSLEGRVDGDRERGSMSKIDRMSGEQMQPFWLKEGVPEEKDMETRRGFLNKQLHNLLGDLETMGKVEERGP